MSASVFKLDHEDNGVIAHSFAVPVGKVYRLVSISFKFNTAPATAEVPKKKSTKKKNMIKSVKDKCTTAKLFLVWLR